MIKPVPYHFNAQKNLEILQKGAFLTSKAGDRVNSMVIGWGSVGVMWRLPVFTVMVRESRFTYDLIQQSKEFTVSIPYTAQNKAFELCGTKSGRDLDKIAASGLALSSGRRIATPVLDIKGMHFECQVLYTRLMGRESLNPALEELWYTRQTGNYHQFCIGEILTSYVIE